MNNHGDKEGEFDSSNIVMKRWAEFERERRWKSGTQSRDSATYSPRSNSPKRCVCFLGPSRHFVFCALMLLMVMIPRTKFTGGMVGFHYWWGRLIVRPDGFYVIVELCLFVLLFLVVVVFLSAFGFLGSRGTLAFAWFT